MNKRRHRKDLEFDQNVCAFCGEASNEKKCGKLFTSKLGFSVHQYCMFFSAALPQNGEDNDGFEGFLERDVLREIKRASRLKCCLCGKKGASAGCCDLHCKRGFHFSCGVNQKYLFQFFGQFRAYCVDHRLHQDTPSYPCKKAKCPICLEPVQCRASADILTTPCCKDVWFHRSCVQEQAKVSGYFFRCAVCNDNDKFVEEMKTMGIYVPDRDAAWEDGNNFAELLEKYSHCDIQSCRCPLGRKYSSDSGNWELVLCSSCGQFGTHVGCKDWSTNPPSLLCPTCRPIHEVDVNDRITRLAVTLTSNQGGTVAKSIQGGSVAKSIQDGSVAKSIQDGSVTKSIQGRCVAKSIQGGSVAKSIQDGSVEKSIQDGSVTKSIQGRCVAKSTQDGSVAKSSPDGSIAKSSRNRKGGRRPRKKRQYVDSDTDSDDIMNVVNGLRRQAENDILNSDTNFIFQRAIAAGTAAMQQSGLSSNRKRKAEDAESDDDIMITKYVPGKKPQNKCQICPKCNRRKPTNTVTRPPEKCPRKVLPCTGISSTVGKNSGSTCTITKADMERKDAGYESEELEMEGGKSDTGTGKCDAKARKVKVADYEILELAAEHTDTSSVLLLPSEHKPNGLVGTLREHSVSKDGSISEGENEQQSNSTSFLRSSVQQLIQFLNPLSSAGTKEEARRLSERSRKVEALASSKNSNVQNAEIDKEVANTTRRNSGSKDKERSEGEVDVTIWLKSSEEQPVSSDGKSEGAERRSASFRGTSGATGRRSASVGGKTSDVIGEKSAIVGKTSTSLGKKSETTVERSESRQMFDWNSNTSKFSNSPPTSRDGKLCPRNGETSKNEDLEFLTKKAVLEAVIDHAMELKNSGKELKHRCVSSC